MNNIFDKKTKHLELKVFHAECRKLAYNKPLWILSIVFLAVIVTILLLVAASTDYGTFIYNSSEDERTAELENYMDYYWYRYNYSIGNYEVLPFGYSGVAEDSTNAEYLWSQYQYYHYLLNTGTDENDYFSINDGLSSDFIRTYNWYPQYKNTVTMVKYQVLAKYALILFALMVAFYVFSMEYINGSIKNIVMAPIKRGAVFRGKLLFSLALETAVFIVILAIGLIFGLQEKVSICIYANGEIIKTSCVEFYMVKMCGTYILMLTVTAISVISGHIAGRAVFGAAVPIGVYILLAILTEILANGAANESITRSIRLSMPLISLDNAVGSFRSHITMLIFGIHFAVAAALLAVSGMIFKRKTV